LFAYKKWLAAIAGLSIILAAVYMLNMIRRVFFGNANAATEHMGDISKSEWVVLTLVAAIILVTGFYPESILGLGREAAAALLQTKV
jgi:NADH-quinone oxidoreductase subunit M